jgi:hypothetical protein
MLSCISIVAEPQVQPELQELERYVHDALGATVKTAPWRGAGNLPPVLRERYKFAQAELLGLRALLIIDSNPEEPPPATVRKHMDMLQARQQADLKLVPRYGDDLYISFIDPVPEDRGARTIEMQASVGGQPVLTINEARDEFMGLGPVEGGDELMAPTTMAPVRLMPYGSSAKSAS